MRYEDIHQAFPEVLPPVKPEKGLSGRKNDRGYTRLTYQNWFIKIANTPDDADKIFREGMMCRRLQGKLSVQIPNPTTLFQQDTAPYAGFTYQRIEGDDLAVGIMKKTVRPKLISQLISLWDEVQQLSSYKDIRPYLIDYQPPILELVDLLPVNGLLRAMKSEEVEKITTFAGWCQRLESPVMPRAFVHGDFWSGNMLVNKDYNFVALLDFSRCWYGDPIVDLAKIGYSDLDLIKDLLIYYNDHFSIIDIDECFLHALLHRGLFILLQLIQTKDVWNYYQKLQWMVLKPFDLVEKLVNQVGHQHQ